MRALRACALAELTASWAIPNASRTACEELEQRQRHELRAPAVAATRLKKSANDAAKKCQLHARS